MTVNQIQYLNYLETARHNRAMESKDERSVAETERHNLASESVELGKLGETQRSNVAGESENIRFHDLTAAWNFDKNAETARHNMASESIDMGELGEKQRSNQANEFLTMRNQDIVQEHYQNQDTGYLQQVSDTGEHYQNQDYIAGFNAREDARHNQETEEQGRVDLGIQQQQADISQQRQDSYNLDVWWKNINGSANSLSSLIKAGTELGKAIVGGGANPFAAVD